ncbi:MAG: hypothetical protein H7Y20_02450, partial [Bryobacteraceae bacterium]|nr:hypothetical protein [Bryobacteraceae bacterium]
MGMLDAIAASLGSAGKDAVTPSSVAVAGSDQRRDSRPVLQLNRFPVTLDANSYKNALSGRNPNGDRRSLFAFRQLVDPIPAFTRSYSPTGSTEQAYQTLLHGASVDGESEFAAGVLSEAKERFESGKIANLDGSPGVWRPVYVVPEDWYAASAERFQRLDIDLNATANSDSEFAVIGGEESLELRLG